MSKSVNLLLLLLLLLLFAVFCSAQPPSCVSSSCGGVNISYPFRLASDPPNCGHPDAILKLQCRENTPILESEAKRFRIHSISYANYSMRVSDLGLDSRNYSSCPLYSSINSFFYTPYISSAYSDTAEIYAFNCNKPINEPSFVENPFCGINSSGIFSYFVVGQFPFTDSSCNLSTITLVSGKILSAPKTNGSYSWETIHDYMAAGIDLYWFLGTQICQDCRRNKGRCLLQTQTNHITCSQTCYEDTPFEDRSFRCKLDYYGILGYVVLVVGAFIALRLILGVLFVIVFLTCKWRRRKGKEETQKDLDAELGVQ